MYRNNCNRKLEIHKIKMIIFFCEKCETKNIVFVYCVRYPIPYPHVYRTMHKNIEKEQKEL